MLRISEQWHASDLGRQRQGNEDNYFVRAPLFVVADGMGGAQAGEVASEMAVQSFDGGLPDGTPAEGLVHVIEGANQRIHERSRAEAQRAGMGTTVTAAYVGEADVTIAHVGDSRAYLLRDGDLVRLTRDHSLVGELVARGKLTEEQAESHPQRSVITRALGPEPHVQVDVQAYQARAGDLFLLCSDGLTSMVPEGRVKPILEGATSLEQAGRELIAAANEAGGRDNITVVLFRLEEVGDGGGTPAEAVEYDTWEGEALGGPRQGTTRPEAHASDEVEAEYRRTGTTALSAVRPRAEPIEEEPAPAQRPRRTRRRRRVPGALIAVAIALAIVLAGLWTASRAVYFVGVEERTNVVTIYRGLPYELPFGIDLYERYYPSGVTLQSIPTARRSTFTDHRLRSKDDAENLVTELERGRIQ
ncbi:MAG: Stp1/IreP family PP2C-type Ser/Thr phosphatase [Solirubrobacteraceae bacterium]